MFGSRRSRNRKSTPRRPARRLKIEELEPRQLLSASGFHTQFIKLAADNPAISGYSPAQMRTAYGFSNVTFGSTPADGRGQTIAIVDAYDDPNIKSDLATFDKTFGIPDPPSFQVVNQTGGTTLPTSDDPTQSWAVEISLDVEWAHAIAPGANIVLVEANAPTDADLFAAVSFARQQPGVSVVSMSFGGQDSLENLPTDQILSKYILVTPAGHQGVTFVASTGDDGFASTPSTMPNVLAVGGTTLNLTTGGAFASELAWGIPASVEGSGGGGISQEFPGRKVPDVSYNAAPETGVAVYDTFGPEGTGWNVIGGTSAGAPQWSALLAIANQGRALAGLDTLNGATQTIPAVYGAPAADFHDIVAGTNNFQDAGPGYDLATGIGSPVADQLIPYLAAYGSTSSGITAAPAAPVSFAASAVSSTDVNLTWSPASGATSYSLYQFQDGQPVLVNTYTAATTSATVGGLTANAAGAFNLVANNSAGSAATPWVSVTPAVSVPANFVGSPLSTTQISLGWSLASGATGYRIYQFRNGQPVLIATLGAGTTNFTVNGLTAGTTYAFDLVAFNGTATAATAWISVTTLPLVFAPTNLTATPVSNTSVTLNWSSAVGAQGYRLYQFINGQPQLINTLGATATSATVNNLIGGTTYAFNLVAFNGTASAATPWVSVTTLGGIIAPASFSGTALSTSQISLSWSASLGATGYRLFEMENGVPVAINTFDATTLSTTVGSLTAGTTYSFSIQAFNATTNAATPYINVTTLSLISIPGSFTATALSGSQISLSWTASSGATGYSLYQFQSGSAVLIATLGATATTFTVNGLSSSTTYDFNLVAFNINNGATAATQWIGATTLGLLSPPTNFTGVGISSSQISLSWTAASGASGYQLYEFVAGAPVLIATLGAGETSHTVSGLSASTTYAFNLVAVTGTITAATPWIGVSTTA